MITLPAGFMPWIKWGALALLVLVAAAITGSLVNSHWNEKWLLRNADDLKAQVKNAEENAAINAHWAQQFANISQQAIEHQRKRDQTYEQTMADYRAGNKRLREQFTCYRDMSKAAASGRPTDDARNCGLSDADVQFLVQFGREANRLRDKVNDLQDTIKVIQNPKK
jgi:hypothetical protein